MLDADVLARLSLFADLSGPELEEVAMRAEEEVFPAGSHVVREGLSGNAFYVILEGRASVVIAGTPRAELTPGDFFGEVSILTGEAVVADVLADGGPLRCAVIAGPDLRPLLHRHPAVAVRMLEAGARRLRATNRWLA